MRADAVLFDLDDTLCVHEQDRQRLLDRTFERVGVEPFTDADGLRHAMDLAPDAPSTTAFLTGAIDVAATRANVSSAPATALAETYMELMDFTAVRFRNGARRALESVDDRPLGLVTNGGRAHQSVKLETLGIDDAFDVVVYGGDETPSKPSTEPFELALADLDVAPEHAVHVGNSFADDVAGANRAGLGSIWVPTETDARESDGVTPDYTVGSLENVPSVLDSDVV